MASTVLTRRDCVDYEDIQGLVRFGYGKMAEACYLLLKIEDRAAFCEWLKTAPLTTAAEKKPPPRTALQIAFTREGLEQLHIPDHVLAGFSPSFISGMAGEENRSRRLGDTGSNSPSKWRWGSAGKVPHVVLMVFAEAGLLGSWRESIKGEFWSAAFSELDCLTTSVSDGREPFGFSDGVSQPDVDWEQRRRPAVNRDQLTYGNLVCLGEFLLGYSNEYAEYTDRPLLDPGEFGSEQLLESEDDQGKKDLGLNGTYVVIRQLEQDVRGFWQYLDKAAACDPEIRFKLAESLVGRRLSDGAPLASKSKTAIAGVGFRGDATDRQLDIEKNQFLYDSDDWTRRCPVGAHVRRANPRNADIPGGDRGWISRIAHLFGFGNKDMRSDLMASTRFHRLLRRGREYGEQLSPEAALEPAPPDDPERGLHFVAINANIERQFEFVQGAWMMGTKFDGLTEESDPILGNRALVRGCSTTDTFSLPQENGMCLRIAELPQFVTVRGGAYFLLPSIRALKYFCKIGMNPQKSSE